MIKIGDDTFEFEREVIDVTSSHRLDVSWVYIDAAQHEHRWYVDGKPADAYNPSLNYDTPTLKWVHDGWGHYPDGERYERAHTECSDCGEHIEARYSYDSYVQRIPGLATYKINGQVVSKDEFQLRAAEAQNLLTAK